jgi:periplasmic protein TonB
LQLATRVAVRENISVSPKPLDMPEMLEAPSARTNISAGHLSVHVDGDHPVEVPFLFDQEPKRLTTSFFAAAALDVAFAGLLIWVSSFPVKPYSTQALLPDAPNNQIVWLSQPGPGGGGGGGGNRMKEPPRQAEAPGKDKITVPVEKKQPVLEQQVAKNEPPPIEQVNIPAKPLAASQDLLPGQIDAPKGPPTLSQGSGSGGGAGTGTGTGIGPGTGSGLGPGSGGGTGGGVYRPGNGVNLPRVIREVRPNYTSDAMRAKVQGVVVLECVVRPDGTVGDVQVIRSLDSTFGLDQEAIKAAKQWRFAPGTRMGEPVPVLVSIELTFTLR